MTTKRPPAELDDDVAWYLQCSPSVMGETSGYGAFVAALERGTVRRGGVADIDIYSDRQIGWGPEERLGEIERARRLRAVWKRLSPEDQDILCLRYTSRSEWPPGVVSRFGQLAAIALYLAPDRSKVLRACECPATPHALSVIDGALKRAERANRRAHEAWRQARRERYQEWAEDQEQLEAVRWRATARSGATSPTSRLVRNVVLHQSAEQQTASLGLVLPESFGDSVPASMPWEEPGPFRLQTR